MNKTKGCLIANFATVPGRVGLSLSLEEIIAAVGARADGSGINAISGR
uniref:Uncharacterized protein n=1 Tax=Klebsiella pneumoniae TaxID=573 RepID=A0A6M3HDJ1_KLEPN|nr:hypothetical protein [Klebsiella pneumoniae]